MKKLMVLFVMFLSVAANALTVSQKRAGEMAAILSSTAVQSLLQQEDGVGNIESISFVPSMTEVSNYVIQFSSYSGPQAQTCIVPASISNANVGVGSPSCSVKASVPSSNSKVCAHPSPIGCLDNQDSNQPQ